MKRCMTQLDDQTLARVSKLRDREERSEAKMIEILVREALDYRDNPLSTVDDPHLRLPQRSDD